MANRSTRDRKPAAAVAAQQRRLVELEAAALELLDVVRRVRPFSDAALLA